ncbi:PilN domain-containing protein [Vogesella urethralis]|jgi:type IV pilus assembly protein PilN|uniref:PilN domain-containing protein n=1 Tax=Vogesella urethralis TaxID=2592656 RepID=UPI001186E62C|nr:PilN domain-containing protein [Vogesella urethralis]MEC5206089.1 type IV pilus assembly protein PilN [Vogesella perlucida]
MIRINLLPHREQKKAAHRKRFQTLMLASLLVAIGLTYLCYLQLEDAKASQLARNQRLDEEIGKINAKLSNIESLRQKKAELLARKQLVERLQYDRTQAVYIFDELIRLMPEGVFLKDFRQTGSNIALSGVALSSARVSLLMRSLAESNTFADPVLIEVSATNVDKIRANQFSLSVTLKAQHAAAPPQGAAK